MYSTSKRLSSVLLLWLKTLTAYTYWLSGPKVLNIAFKKTSPGGAKKEEKKRKKKKKKERKKKVKEKKKRKEGSSHNLISRFPRSSSSLRFFPLSIAVSVALSVSGWTR